MNDRDPGRGTVISEIEAAESARQAATLAADVDALQRLLADDLRYVHSSGVDEDKRTYVDRIASGHYRYHALQSLRRDYRILDDVVLVNGDTRIEVSVRGQRKVVDSRYLQVWHRGPDGWQMLSWQSTPLASD